ncbi:MAG: DNA polymerase I [Phycisphaerales bacterium]|nr:DNA polymerase I [Planctomycetota bacterium]MCH8509050.1 DNA polymerase I [Phycisphaerales bacterium]
MKTLYIIDGYAQFFRAYHAIRSRMSSPVTGEPTNMTFGFVGMLLKLLRRDAEQLKGDGDPTYLAVALDVGGDRGTFRTQLYPDYKATRDAPPEDLGPQVERALKILEVLGVPVIGAEGFEADDVIATIASAYSARHPDIRVRIISKDKDLKQLLGEGSPHTEMYDIHTDILITERTLRDELGITPAQVVDMLALMGDTVDNVPGVVGIGPKTAAQLIAEHGTLDAVVQAAEEGRIKGKRGENILAAREHLPLSKQLVSLRHDVPIDLDLEAARTDTLRIAELMPVLRELGFNRYQDELKAMLGQATPEPGGSATKPARGSGDAGFGTLFEQQAEQAVRAADGDYHTITTKKDLDALVARMRTAPVVAVDTETTHLRPMLAQLAGVCISVQSGEGFYIPVRSPDPSSHLDEATVIAALRPALEDPGVPKVGHNLKFDLNVLRNAGVRLAGDLPSAEHPLAGDTMIASYVLDPSRSSHSMDALAMALLDRTNISIKDLIGSGKHQKRFDEVPLAQAGPYSAEDADVTLQLDHALAKQLAAEPTLETLYRTVEMPLVPVLAELEYNGVLVDPDELDRQRERLQTRIDDLAKQIDAAALDAIDRTFDHNSPKQLGEALFNKPDHPDKPGLGLKPIKKTKTGFSTDAEVLEKLALDDTLDPPTPIPSLILEYRQLTKLVNTYLAALKDEIHPVTKRIHASFNQTVAITGRLSSSDPNLQNIPIRTDIGRDIRKAFVAPPGRVLITADYSQIELRVLAHLSQDPALIAAFLAGEDIHTAVAAQIHAVPLEQVTREQRSGAKMVNFGIVYGVTPYGLARRLGVSNTEAAAIIDGYKARFAGITTFLAECVEQAIRHGFVATMLGRRRPIPEIESSNPQRRALAERTAINTVVQGSAADLIKLAMIDLHARIGAAAGADPLAGTKMILQIHDELVFETPQDRAVAAMPVIVERMEAAMDLSVPLRVDAHAGASWFEGK